MKETKLSELFNRCLRAKYIHTVEDGDYAIEREGDTLYLLFQWSHSHMDWVSNFDFPARAYKNGEDKWRVHRGFLRVWKAMRDEIERKVIDELNEHEEIAEIVCVGYSHGAAIALLATEDMQYLFGENKKISGFGFGAPRVVWGKLPAAVAERVGHFKAICHKQDIVTHLPPVMFGFRHPNILRLTTQKKLNCVDAHRPENYMETAEKYFIRERNKG